MSKVKSIMRKYPKLWILAVCAIMLSTGTLVYAALTIDPEAITDWTAVAQNTVGESGTITCSGNYIYQVCVQAFNDSNTAHTGTEFILQVSSKDSGDEDWHTFLKWHGLVGTADMEPIDDDALVATSTTITLSNTGGNYETAPMARWLAIEDGTLVNSELVLSTGYTTDTSITILDGTTNEHAVSTLMSDIADTWTFILPLGTNRARLIPNNTYDPDGSSINYKVNGVEATGL